jgi:hypothetical protein
MAYTINKTDGTVLAVVEDSTLDTTSDLKLIGKKYAGYGEAQNENFIFLLENFANTTPPPQPLDGQLWYDTAAGSLNVYSGATWSIASGVESSATPPTGPATGDLWFDTSTAQLKVYGGAGWIIVGPQYENGVISGPIVEEIIDDGALGHLITSIYIEDIRIMIISADSAFTPATPIAGFPTINPGTNVNNTIPGIKYHGTATDSDSLGGLLASSFLRSDLNDSTTGQLTIANDNGLLVGADSDLSLSVNGAEANIKNVTSNADIIFGINLNGTPTDSITIDGATNTTTIHGDLVAEGNFSITGDTIGTHNGEITIVPNNGTDETCYIIFADGATGAQQLESDVSLNYNPSTNILSTTATAAQYADLAEKYTTPSEYAPGTVVQVAKQGTAEAVEYFTGMHVLGVISTAPAFIMNSEGEGQIVGLVGRVPVKISGTVSRGDIVYADPTNTGTAGRMCIAFK